MVQLPTIFTVTISLPSNPRHSENFIKLIVERLSPSPTDYCYLPRTHCRPSFVSLTF